MKSKNVIQLLKIPLSNILQMLYILMNSIIFSFQQIRLFMRAVGTSKSLEILFLTKSENEYVKAFYNFFYHSN